MLGTDQITGVLSNEQMTLREIIARLEETYCGTIGYEYMHIKNRQECNWIRDKIERRAEPISREEQLRILDRLQWAELFESYVAGAQPPPSPRPARPQPLTQRAPVVLGGATGSPPRSGRARSASVSRAQRRSFPVSRR